MVEMKIFHIISHRFQVDTKTYGKCELDTNSSFVICQLEFSSLAIRSILFLHVVVVRLATPARKQIRK